MKKDSKLIDFYSGKAPDAHGRYLNEILSWDYETLESTHNYIQWLFPLDTSSNFNLDAPVLTPIDKYIFSGSVLLKENIMKSFLLMLDFYGFQHRKSGKIVQSSSFKQRETNWLNHGNHNMLRISRILRSLCLLGLNDTAHQFFSALCKVYKGNPKPIGISFKYWHQAVEASLYRI